MLIARPLLKYGRLKTRTTTIDGGLSASRITHPTPITPSVPKESSFFTLYWHNHFLWQIWEKQLLNILTTYCINLLSSYKQAKLNDVSSHYATSVDADRSCFNANRASHHAAGLDTDAAIDGSDDS